MSTLLSIRLYGCPPENGIGEVLSHSALRTFPLMGTFPDWEQLEDFLYSFCPSGDSSFTTLEGMHRLVVVPFFEEGDYLQFVFHCDEAGLCRSVTGRALAVRERFEILLRDLSRVSVSASAATTSRANEIEAAVAAAHRISKRYRVPPLGN